VDVDSPTLNDPHPARMLLVASLWTNGRELGPGKSRACGACALARGGLRAWRPRKRPFPS